MTHTLDEKSLNTIGAIAKLLWHVRTIIFLIIATSSAVGTASYLVFTDYLDHREDRAKAIEVAHNIIKKEEAKFYGSTRAPIIFAAAIALFLAVPSHDIVRHAKENGIELINSRSPGGSPASGVDNSEVQREISSFLVRIGADDLERTITLVKAFNERTGGTVGTSVMP